MVLPVVKSKKLSWLVQFFCIFSHFFSLSNNFSHLKSSRIASLCPSNPTPMYTLSIGHYAIKIGRHQNSSGETPEIILCLCPNYNHTWKFWTTSQEVHPLRSREKIAAMPKTLHTWPRLMVDLPCVQCHKLMMITLVYQKLWRASRLLSSVHWTLHTPAGPPPPLPAITSSPPCSALFSHQPIPITIISGRSPCVSSGAGCTSHHNL